MRPPPSGIPWIGSHLIKSQPLDTELVLNDSPSFDKNASGILVHAVWGLRNFAVNAFKGEEGQADCQF